jgi:glycosyltransferase involved in cell wall biosynthesis
MRIALVSQEYPPASHGGIGAQTQIKARGLASRGHAVHVLAHSTNGEREEYSDEDIHVVRVPAYDERMPVLDEAVRWLTYSVRVAEELARLNASHSLDIVEFAEWGAEGYTFLLNRAEYAYTPVVIQLHGPLVMFAHTMNWPDQESEFYRIGTHMESTCLRLADAVYSSSQCSIDWCTNYYQLSSRHVPILHTGVDTGLFRPLDADKEARPTIVFVGKLVENKGVLELAEAGLLLLNEFPDLQIWLFGRGEPAVVARLEALGRKSARRDFLQLRGFTDREKLPEVLNRAHVFAAPSLYEGGPGFVYLEAMSCALPVIACSGSGVAEVVTPEETGLLVPPRDPQALAQALRRLLRDPALRQSLGGRARDYVLAKADSQRCLRRLESLYQAVVAQQRGA